MMADLTMEVGRIRTVDFRLESDHCTNHATVTLL